MEYRKCPVPSVQELLARGARPGGPGWVDDYGPEYRDEDWRPEDE